MRGCGGELNMASRKRVLCRTNVCCTSAAIAATISLVCSMAMVSSALDTSLYSRMEQLDPAFILHWQLNQTDSSIRFAIKAKTAGYIALGISEVGAMVGSDMMIGTVENGMAMVVDAFAYNKTQAGVAPDSQQDVKTIAGEESVDESGDRWTTIEFSRKLNTSDCNDRIISEGTNQIIWAMGAADVPTYHGGQRGGTQLVFFGEAPNTVVPAGHEVYNLTVPEFNVPTNYTTYTCNTFNLTFPKKRHVSSYSVVIDTNAPKSLHHIVIHACTEEEQPEVLKRKGNDICGLDIGCSRIIAMWAVGGKPVVLPENVGLPVGPETPASVVVMQVHYTNPEGRADIVDRSGISFTLAPMLRPIDAGIFAAGPYAFEAQVLIPPKQNSWKMESSCTAGCTAADISGNITVIGSTLHQHVLGKQLMTKLYRNGSEIATIGRADYYDFEFQTMVRPPKPVVVLPGDVLKTTCVWDSTGRTTPTVGGESTLQEMCLNYILYYPLQDKLLGGCFDSCVNPKAVDFMTLFQPPFEGEGVVYQVCNDDEDIQSNKTCLFAPTGGQNEVVPPLAGCPTSSLSEISPATKSGLQVPAAMAPTTDAGTASTSCSSPFGGSNVLFETCQTLSGGYSLKWNTPSASTVRVSFSLQHDGWISLGLSPSGQMVGSDAVVGFPSDKGVTVDVYYLGGKSSDAVKPSGKLIASSLQGEFVGGEVRLLFTLNLTAEQIKSTKIIWAKGRHDAANGLTLRGHSFSDAYSGSVSFESGSTATASRDNLRNIHGIINALGWGILIPVGALLARHGKSYDPAWYYGHITVQSSGFLLGVAGFATGIVLHNRSKVQRTTHFALAITILVLSVLQIAGAIVKPKKDAKIRWAWNIYHHWIGRIAIVLAVANIYVGLGLLKPGSGWVIAYSVILGVLVAAAVVLEALKVVSDLKKKESLPASNMGNGGTRNSHGEKPSA
eukprot:TRINITY_DN834_c0_g1_i1.p1 TRINITY_DN834_c0_g1~~TRINITY_DN834_c0_g1_i1.p1  ORF type:complete len:951 (-),score=143.11 TRINITY_DN834_c0_g1_i1:668-3520(-)